MQEMIMEAAIVIYTIMTIVSVLCSIIMFDELHKETGDSGYVELVLCTILVMIGSLTFLCIPWHIGTFIHYRKKKRINYKKGKEKKSHERTRGNVKNTTLGSF